MSMTENEAKRPKVAIVGGGRNAVRTLKAHIDILEELQAYRAIGTVEELKALKNKHIGKDNMVISSSDLMTILNSDSEELKQYKEVGTVEEFKTFKEKSVAKKPFQPFGTHSYKCSNCWKFVAHEVDDNCDLSSLAEWCPYCGSRIDWTEIIAWQPLPPAYVPEEGRE